MAQWSNCVCWPPSQNPICTLHIHIHTHTHSHSLSLSCSLCFPLSLPLPHLLALPSFWLCCQGYRTASCCIYLDEAAACGSLSLSLSPPEYKQKKTYQEFKPLSVFYTHTHTHTHPHSEIVPLLTSHTSSASDCRFVSFLHANTLLLLPDRGTVKGLAWFLVFGSCSFGSGGAERQMAM